MKGDQKKNTHKKKKQKAEIYLGCFLVSVEDNCCAPCGGSLRDGIRQSDKRTQLKGATVVGFLNEGVHHNDLL